MFCHSLDPDGSVDPARGFTMSMFGGLLLGLLIFPKLSDLSGRKAVFFLGVFMHLMLIATTFVVSEVQWFYGIVFLMGLE